MWFELKPLWNGNPPISFITVFFWVNNSNIKSIQLKHVQENHNFLGLFLLDRFLKYKQKSKYLKEHGQKKCPRRNSPPNEEIAHCITSTISTLKIIVPVLKQRND